MGGERCGEGRAGESERGGVEVVEGEREWGGGRRGGGGRGGGEVVEWGGVGGGGERFDKKEREKEKKREIQLISPSLSMAVINDLGTRASPSTQAGCTHSTDTGHNLSCWHYSSQDPAVF